MSELNQNLDTNPLLQGLKVDLDQAELWQLMARNPLRGENFAGLSPARKDMLLDNFQNLYAPTTKIVEIAYFMHRMLINSLVERHPYNEEQRRHAYWCAAEAQQAGLGGVSTFNSRARGMLLEGITKQGKSTLIKNFLACYPQTIERDSDPRAGWLSLRQLVYLVTPMPSDASKLGFLQQAFYEFDRVMGTNHAKEISVKKATIDQLLIKFLNLLVQHRCGILVIEEAQEDNNLAKHRFGRDFQSFFLRVLNSGIPTVLVGNPLAFEEIKKSSQLMSRFADSPDAHLAPTPNSKLREWTEDLVPFIWQQTVLPEPDEDIDDLDDLLWKATQGCAYYLSILRRETLRAALNEGAHYVEFKHIKAGMQTKVMQIGTKIMASYWRGVAGNDVDFNDIPGHPNPALFQPKSRRGANAQQAY